MKRLLILILAALMMLGFSIACEPERQPEEPMDPPPVERPYEGPPEERNGLQDQNGFQDQDDDFHEGEQDQY